jgi:hypothetical protein
VLRPLLPARSSLPRPDTGPLRRRCGFLLRLAPPGARFLSCKPPPTLTAKPAARTDGPRPAGRSHAPPFQPDGSSRP